jgi:hypothetical protein
MEADPIPDAIIYDILARLRAIWCAARWIAPIDPVITVATLKAPTSKIYWSPEANPILKISLI